MDNEIQKWQLECLKAQMTDAMNERARLEALKSKNGSIIAIMSLFYSLASLAAVFLFIANNLNAYGHFSFDGISLTIAMSLFGAAGLFHVLLRSVNGVLGLDDRIKFYERRIAELNTSINNILANDEEA